ncbi:MAG TPA: class I SAM-dependent methyltransferase [Ilumatobacteraceae bacterium]|nr:class I SAM-dependent methyltransferase [Ilumatobacteraceae bacterium]HRB03714.1 class I SAM-dependent methyltransferase [Ilumatobacteraceae bacterium]
MRGYDDSSYGDSFAEVYDEWYHGISDVGATVTTLVSLAQGGRVLELGVGTGRLAVPLAAAGLEVHGLDSSELMLQQMAMKDGGAVVHAHRGDMVHDLPEGPFSLVFVAYNTFFNLLTHERQQSCFAAVADALVEGGCFVIEAFVPDPEHDPASNITVRSIAADRVVLSVSTTNAIDQVAEGQFIDITEAGGVRLRPWSIRWATTVQLDDMATAAGLRLADRWEAFDRTPFTTESERQVSVFCKGNHPNSSPVRPSPSLTS